jgi:murein tripeptide amidase MpaA
MFPEKQLRPAIFDKKYVLISARVHPGETPSSFMLKGLLDFLGDGSIDANTFLNEYVLLVIPMLNPDGVVRGH